MRIAGLQKLTLLDYPGKVACTIFTPGCNLRCPFCHNAGLVTGAGALGADDMLPEDEVLSFLEKRKGILEGVVITGGEPLLFRDIPEFLEKIKLLGYPVKIDTNGTNPGMLRELVSAGFADYVAVDIKSSPKEYARAAGTEDPGLESIEKTIAFLLEGDLEYEFRTTCVKGLHTPEIIREAAGMIAGAEKYFLQDYKDSGSVISPAGLAEFSADEMNALLSAAREFVPGAQLRGV